MKSIIIASTTILLLIVVFLGCASMDPGHANNTNKQCFTCHDSQKKDKWANKHMRHNVGCAKCHGPSTAHMNDEKHLTPPDIMFTRSSIKEACFKCHKESKLAKKSKHKTAFAPTSSKVCTDCHGKKHKIKDRKIRWDKATRKIIEQKK